MRPARTLPVRWTRLALAALLVPAASAGACGDVVATSAWVRTPPPGARMAAAYFTLENRGPRAARIVGVASPDFAGGTLHETRYVDGTARMRRLESVELPPGATVRFAPGGPHAMLGAPRAEFANGDVVQLRLECAGDAALDLSATVADSAPANGADSP